MSEVPLHCVVTFVAKTYDGVVQATTALSCQPTPYPTNGRPILPTDALPPATRRELYRGFRKS